MIGKRTELIQIRCRPEEKENFKRKAEENQMTIPEYIRYLIKKQK